MEGATLTQEVAEEANTSQTASETEKGSITRKARVDFFLAALFKLEIEVTEEMFERMVGAAAEFLLTCRGHEWKDWERLDDLSRDAFIQAAGMLKARAVLSQPPIK